MQQKIHLAEQQTNKTQATPVIAKLSVKQVSAPSPIN